MTRLNHPIVDPRPENLHLLPAGRMRDDFQLPANPVCYSCKTRFEVGPPRLEPPAELYVSTHLPGVLAAFAREFDETAQELEPDKHYTAVDFIDWLKPSLRSGRGNG